MAVASMASVRAAVEAVKVIVGARRSGVVTAAACEEQSVPAHLVWSAEIVRPNGQIDADVCPAGLA